MRIWIVSGSKLIIHDTFEKIADVASAAAAATACYPKRVLFPAESFGCTRAHRNWRIRVHKRNWNSWPEFSPSFDHERCWFGRTHRPTFRCHSNSALFDCSELAHSCRSGQFLTFSDRYVWCVCEQAFGTLISNIVKSNFIVAWRVMNLCFVNLFSSSDLSAFRKLQFFAPLLFGLFEHTVMSVLYSNPVALNSKVYLF